MADPFVIDEAKDDRHIVTFTKHYGTPPRSPYSQQLEEAVTEVTHTHIDPAGFPLGSAWLKFLAGITERAELQGKLVGIGPLDEYATRTADAYGLRERLKIVASRDDTWKLT